MTKNKSTEKIKKNQRKYNKWRILLWLQEHIQSKGPAVFGSDWDVMWKEMSDAAENREWKKLSGIIARKWVQTGHDKADSHCLQNSQHVHNIWQVITGKEDLRYV